MDPGGSPFPQAARVPLGAWPSPPRPRLGLERSFPIPCCALEKSLFRKYFFRGFCWPGQSVRATQADSLRLGHVALPLLSLGELLARAPNALSRN